MFAERAAAAADDQAPDVGMISGLISFFERRTVALDRAVAAAADPEVSRNSDRTDQALDELIVAARETFVVLQSHVQLVGQAARDYERDPDPALPGQDDVVRPPDVESEPAGDFAGWVRQINAAVAEAERAAAEAEQAAAGSGSLVLALVGVHQRRGTRGAGEPPRPEPGCLREGAKSYVKVKHVLRRRRGCCTPVQVARTFSPCSRNCPCGPTYL